VTRAQTVKVSRTRLIERLKQAQKDAEKNRDGAFKVELADHVKAAKRDVAEAEKALAKLEQASTPEDVRDHYWARSFLRSDDLAKQITLLELSDEETINVGPTSNLWGWL
jgi:uncharacterized damage-inducible protein DinB